MPCGGIIIYRRTPEEAKSIRESLVPEKGGCFVCSRGGAHHFCHDWGTFIHARCTLAWLLSTEEGRSLIEKKREIHLDFSIEQDFTDGQALPVNTRPQGAEALPVAQPGEEPFMRGKRFKT